MDDSAVARALNGGMTISQMQARIAKLERQLADRQRAAAMQANVNARLGYITTSAGAALCDVSADGATIALEFDNKATAQNGGIGFFGMLTILFIGLKLTHYIDWSWLWVLSPLWLPLAVVLVIVAVVFLGIAVKHVMD